jgi:DNA repair protein RecO (recombination protein O)
MAEPRETKITGIVIRKTKFKDTSLIIEVFSIDSGKISILAKGIRKEKSKFAGLIELLNELEFVLHKQPGSDLYILKSTSLIRSYIFDVNFRTNLLMSASVEFIRQLIIPEEDYIPLYNLLLRYLEYIKEIKQNGIAIFWRFLLQSFNILGISLDLAECVHCGKSGILFYSFYPIKSGFICSECSNKILSENTVSISKEASELLSQIYGIGNKLYDIEISKNTIHQINRIFLLHLTEHFHKKFNFKSLKMY